MVNIFILEDNIVKPNPELLLLSPFKEIWENDRSPKKEYALKEFGVVEFFMSVKKSNPFRGYLDDDERMEKITSRLFTTPYTPSPLVLEAIELYRIFLTDASSSYRLFISMRKTAETLRMFLETIDMDAMNSRGLPLYKAGEVIAAAEKMQSLNKSLQLLEATVNQELTDTIKTKANREINPFER